MRETTSRTLASPRSSGTSNADCAPGRSSSCTTCIPGPSGRCRRSCRRSGSEACAQCPSRSCSPSILRQRISDVPTIRPREAHRRHDRARRRRRRVGGAGGAAPGVKRRRATSPASTFRSSRRRAGNLLCNIKTSLYSRAQQNGCQARTGLDWHGFELSNAGKAQPVCTGGVLYDIGRDTPTFVVLAYGHSWRSHGFTCSSRLNGSRARTGTGTASSCRASRSGFGSRLALEREQVVDRLAAADQPCVPLATSTAAGRGTALYVDDIASVYAPVTGTARMSPRWGSGSSTRSINTSPDSQCLPAIATRRPVRRRRVTRAARHSARCTSQGVDCRTCRRRP